MSDIGTAYVQIEPTAKGISGKIEKEMGGAGTSSGNSFNKGFGSVLGGTAKMISGAVAAGGAALAAASAGFVKASGDVAAYGDNIDKMSQKMGISAEAYQEWDAIMQHSGTSIEALKPSMKTLANAAQNSAEEFKKLGISEKELQTLSQEDLFSRVISGLQGMEEGTERTAISSKLLGRGATELGALLNTSAEDTEKMRQAVHDLGGVMSNEAVKAAAAYQDQLQDMQTAFQGLTRNLMSQFLPQITEIMGGLTDIFTGNSDRGIGKITQGIRGIADSLMQALPEIMSVASNIISALGQAIINNLPLLASAGIPIIQELAQGLLEAVPSAMPVIMQVVNGLLDLFLKLAPELLKAGVEIILQLADGITKALPELIPTITSVIIEMVRILTNPDTLTSIIQAGVSLISALVDGLMQAIPQLTASAPEIVQNLVDAITQGLPVIIDGSMQLVQAIVDNMPTIIQALIDCTPQIVESIANGLIQAAPLMITAGPLIIAQLVIGLVNQLPQLVALGKDFVMSIIKGLSSAYASLSSEGPKMLKNLYDRMTPEMKKFIQQGKEIIKQIIDGISQFAGNLYSKAVEIVNNFRAKLDEKIKAFTDIGKNIVEGIKEGIVKGWDELVNWFKNKLKGLKEAAEDLLKIKSPSKVFADEIGRMIPLGIAEGINDGMGELDNAVIDMTTGITTTAGNSMAATYQPAANNEILELLREYLPDISKGKTFTLKFDVDGNRLFRLMQIEEAKNAELVGV